jgi:ADP-heptose:LPS heptosyltransferase
VWSANADEIARGLERVGVARVLTAPAVPTDETPTAAHYLRTLAPLGVTPVPFALHAPTAARAATEYVWRTATRLPTGATAPVVLLHPGAGSPIKLWPLAHYRALARRLRDEGLVVVWTAGEADSVIRAQLDDSTEQSYVLPTLDLAGLTAVIERAAVVVSGDCGVAHLAALAGARGAALFGPTDARIWGPPSPHTTVVHLSLPCAPCGAIASVCPSRICLRALSVDAVYTEVRRQIEGWAHEQEVNNEATHEGRVWRPSPSRPADCHPPAPVPGPPGALQAAVWGNPNRWVLRRSTEPE